MSKIMSLLKAYQAFVRLPWQNGLSGPEKVWFCLYEPRDERRLRTRLDEFALATQEAGHAWTLFDVTTAFETWMVSHEYRDGYFAEPQYLGPALDDFLASLSERLQQVLQSADRSTVVAVTGAGALFGLVRVSALIERVAQHIRGRLLVFFPGTREGASNYRLLDGRDGWNYLAIPIEAEGKRI
ncbi:MAG TPA: DUF1788 domain-containing protein [Firmicutes bacterium]|nr:DUF1788 domain-containing protein [Bacillota bacterium]